MSTTDVYSGIVVGVDGSETSAAAVRWAAGAAALRKVPLTLVHVMTATAVGAPLMWPAGPIPDSLIQWQEDEARRILASSAEIAETQIGGEQVQIVTGVVRSAPVPSLVDASKHAQLVVVGSRGQGAMRRVLLGSVSSGLVQHAHCPVAVIRAESPEYTAEFARRPVLVGIDGSASAERATAVAFEEASYRGVDLIALHAWSDEDVADIPTLELSAVQQSAELVLSERLAGWQERYPDVNVDRRIVGDKPARHLVDASEDAQLVVVGSRGRGGFTGMLLGSVSRAVVNAATVPVIVAR
ncbi:universal stress protein [Mycolicibacterium thermoresistibile]